MYKTITEIDGYRLRLPLSGGKAGKGKAKISRVQIVRMSDWVNVKSTSFIVNNIKSYELAIMRAKEYVKEIINHKCCKK